MLVTNFVLPVRYPPEQGGRRSQEAVVAVGLVPRLNPLRKFLMEVGQEGRRPPWCCQHRDVGRTSIATRSQLLH